MTTHRRWLLHGPNRLVLTEAPTPAVAPDGVLVRIEAANMLSYFDAVLAASLPYALPPYPFVPGTNAVGRVVATGPEVHHVVDGDRVFLSPHLVVRAPGVDPVQILIGLTAMGRDRSGAVPEAALRLQSRWPDGAYAEIVHWPADAVTPLKGLDHLPAERLVGLAKLVVPYGGLLRADLRPGHTVIVNGATGYFGSGGVLAALAMGARRVVAAGRDKSTLAKLAALHSRVAVAALDGEPGHDRAVLGEACAGLADRALDMLGRAASTATTGSTLRSLKPGGRMVLMGSAGVPLEIGFAEMLANEWEIVGCFMYPQSAPSQLAALLQSGLLSLDAVGVRSFPFERLADAIAPAAAMRGLDNVVIAMDQGSSQRT
ncbi:MAG TPA: medium chain dehydrogenase/reductase family protein [Rubrivivax sp.]|nr:medium chain dehydrogenase/reductase family protein [Rubrivivax sp.]